MRIEVNLEKKIATETENQNYSGAQRLQALRDQVSAANPLSLQALTAITEPRDLYLSYNRPFLKITIHIG